MIGINNNRHVRIAAEGTLIGSFLSHGINKNIVMVSNDAGQFDVLLHALCYFYKFLRNIRCGRLTKRDLPKLSSGKKQKDFPCTLTMWPLMII